MDLGAVGPWAGVAIGVLGAGGGVWGWLSTRTTAKAAAGPAQTSAEGTLLAAQAAFQEALTRTSNTFADVTERLLAVQRDEIQCLEVRVEDLEDENAKCRKETQALRGEIRQRDQLLGVMTRKAREHGWDFGPEAAVVGIVEVEADGLTVIKPVKARARRRR